jgi:hypothetical protein
MNCKKMNDTQRWAHQSFAARACGTRLLIPPMQDKSERVLNHWAQVMLSRRAFKNKKNLCVGPEACSCTTSFPNEEAPLVPLPRNRVFWKNREILEILDTRTFYYCIPRPFTRTSWSFDRFTKFLLSSLFFVSHRYVSVCMWALLVYRGMDSLEKEE